MWVIKTDLSGDWNCVSLPGVLVFVCVAVLKVDLRPLRLFFFFPVLD